MLVKCKPVYNFQSVEFEMEINSPDDTEKMFIIYKEILDGLQKIAVDQPSPTKAPVKPKEEMATPKQVECLVNLGEDEEEMKKLTKKAAAFKIKELLG